MGFLLLDPRQGAPSLNFAPGGAPSQGPGRGAGRSHLFLTFLHGVPMRQDFQSLPSVEKETGVPGSEQAYDRVSRLVSRALAGGEERCAHKPLSQPWEAL